MMDNIAEKTCEFEHEIVSYMYDELSAAERTRFETHLADCGACTDEFAAVSFSRFSVFEWQKEEFAHLATPKIVIPYESKKAAIESSGWFAGLTEIFAFARSPLAVGAAFAVILAVGVAGFNLLGSGGSEIAGNTAPLVVVPNKAEQAKVAETPVGEKDIVAPNEIRPVTAVSRDVRSRIARQTGPRRATETRVAPVSIRQARRAPVLSDLGDDEEDSLRLSDMLDGIGG